MALGDVHIDLVIDDGKNRQEDRRSVLNVLLSCQFCGGTAKTKSVEYEPNSWQVVCADRNCLCGWHDKHDETELRAIIHWNKRKGGCLLYIDPQKFCQALKERRKELAR